MRKSIADIVRCSLAWWRSRRPVAYQESDHLSEPAIKRTGVSADEDLATAVAEYLKADIKRRKRRAKNAQ